jgi:DNA-binding PadR family transcriptional regulator
MSVLVEDGLVLNLVGEMRRGTLVVVVLLLSEKPAYGYSLVEQLAARGVTIEQNTLYPLLRRLESQGLLSSTWDTSSARPRKYYALSESGRRVRGRLLAEWRELNRVLESIAEETSHEDS